MKKLIDKLRMNATDESDKFKYSKKIKEKVKKNHIFIDINTLIYPNPFKYNLFYFLKYMHMLKFLNKIYISYSIRNF